MLPRSFGIPKEDEMLASVHCLEDAVACSAKAGEFCRQRNISERRSCAISLAIEEMASNVIQHGFADGKSHRLELRLAKKKEELILYMRDNCRTFDPKAFYQTMYTGEDPDSFLGIHIVMSTAREVNYTSTFGLNTLTSWV